WIIIGIGVMVAIAERLGVTLSIGDLEARGGAASVVTMAASVVIGGAWAIGFYTRMRGVGLIAAGGAVDAALCTVVYYLGLRPDAGGRTDRGCRCGRLGDVHTRLLPGPQPGERSVRYHRGSVRGGTDRRTDRRRPHRPPPHPLDGARRLRHHPVPAGSGDLP